MDSPNVPQSPGGRIRALGFRAVRRGAPLVAINNGALATERMNDFHPLGVIPS